MTTQATESRALDGYIELAVPPGLFDVMAPEDEDEAAVVFADVFRRMAPKADEEQVDALVEGIMMWRRSLVGQGLVLHGLVAVPAGYEVDGETLETPAHWHILAGVVEVPVAGELDAGEVGARYFAQQLSEEHTYTENFDTRMGWGVGIVTTVPLRPVDQIAPEVAEGFREATGTEGVTAQPLPPRLGFAGALAAPRNSDKGLLVAGFCLDSERAAQMGMLVAVIAGQSMIHLDGHIEVADVADETPHPKTTPHPEEDGR